MIASKEPSSTEVQSARYAAAISVSEVPSSSTRLARGLWLGPLAWLVALLGLGLYGGDEPGRTAGLVLLPVAGVLAVAAWHDWRTARSFAPGSQVGADRNPRRLTLGVVGSLVIILAADILSTIFNKEPFGLAGVLWLASIGLLLYGSYSRLQGPTPADPSDELYATSPGVPWPQWELLALVGLTILAAVLRLWDLTSFPSNIYPDEIMSGQVAISSYLNPAVRAPSVFSTVWGEVDLPALWFLFVSGLIKLFGSALWVLRLPGALFGAATVVPFYALVRSNWGRAAAIAGTAVLAFSAADVHYSRLALNNIVTPFFWTVCFYFLLRGLQTRRPFDWVCAGLAAGLSEYGFYATRLLPFILLAFFVYLLAVRWRAARRYIGHFGLLVVGYVVGFGPLLAYFIKSPKVYFGHGAARLIFDHYPRCLQEAEEMAGTLWSVLGDNLLGLSTRPSQDVIYFAPLLLPVEAALVVLGVALLVWRWRQPAAFLMLLSGFGVIFVGGTLVADAPALNHWTAAFSVFYVALALPIGAWVASVRAALSPAMQRLAYGGLAAALVVLGLVNVGFYFGSYYANPDVLVKAPYRTAQGYYEIQSVQSRYQASLGPAYQVRVVGPEVPPYDPEMAAVLVKGQDWARLLHPESDLPVQRAPGKGLAFIFFAGNEQYRDPVRNAHPGGTDGEVLTPTGKHLFYTYVIPPEK